MYSIVHLILIFLFLICNTFVIFSKNPVHSVLFLILSFSISSMILFLFKIDFLALLYIIIYVGALAILFLFVIMMLNAKYVFSSDFYSLYFFIILIFSILLFNIFLFINEIFSNFLFDTSDIFLFIDFFYNINSFGQIFFNYYISIVLIAGLVLLLALVSSIALTIRQNKIN